jgi:hypothetical protein
MRDIIFILIFSVVLLFFTAYPAIKIADFFNKKKHFSSSTYNILTILLTIFLALMGGIFLRFWKI